MLSGGSKYERYYLTPVNLISSAHRYPSGFLVHTMHPNGRILLLYARLDGKLQSGISSVATSPIAFPARRLLKEYAFYVLFAKLTELRIHPYQYSVFLSSTLHPEILSINFCEKCLRLL